MVLGAEDWDYGDYFISDKKSRVWLTKFWFLYYC